MKIFGLAEKAFDELISLFSQKQNIEKVVLFGSRAMGNYQEGSDIDLALFGPNLKLNDQLDLTWKMEKLDYPYTYDFQIHKNILDQDVKDHIDRGGIIIYQKLSRDASGWKECKLGDVITLQRGHDLPKSKMKEGHIPVAGSNGIIGCHNKATTNAPGITIGRSGNLGNAYFYKEDFWAHNTTLYVKDFKGNNELFIYYFLKTFDFRQFNVGSAVPTLNRNHIHPLDVIVPPLPEQKAIASVLSSLDDKIDLLHRQNKTLEAMAETLFRQWFVEEAQEDWEEVKLDSLINISSGKGLKKEHVSENGAYPVLGANGEIGRTNEFLFDESLLFTGRVGTLGNIFRVENEKVWLSDNTLIIRSKNYFNFIYFVLKTAKLEEYNVGSTQPLIRQSDIKEIEISLPSEKKLQKFEKESELLLNKIRQNKSQIRTLEKLRDTLLPKLMSGAVKVKSLGI